MLGLPAIVRVRTSKDRPYTVQAKLLDDGKTYSSAAAGNQSQFGVELAPFTALLNFHPLEVSRQRKCGGACRICARQIQDELSKKRKSNCSHCRVYR